MVQLQELIGLKAIHGYKEGTKNFRVVERRMHESANSPKISDYLTKLRGMTVSIWFSESTLILENGNIEELKTVLKI